MARAPKKVTVAEVPEVKLPEEEAVVEETPVEKEEVKVEPVKEVVSVELPEIPETAPALPKNVKIRVVRNHRCTIGDTLYVFEVGKSYNVPDFVKDILKKADLLDVL